MHRTGTRPGWGATSCRGAEEPGHGGLDGQASRTRRNRTSAAGSLRV